MSARLRGQRISRDELIVESREVLKNAGVTNHSRALLLSGATAELIKSDNPAFQQLRPRVLKRNSIPWIRAYAIIAQYLEEHRLPITLETIQTENGGPIQAVNDAASSADSQLSDAIAAAPEKASVAENVRQLQNRPRPVIEVGKSESASPEPVVEEKEVKAEPSPVREEEKPQPTKRKRSAPKKTAGKGKVRTTPRREAVLCISSPGRTPDDIPSDSELQSDFVIEEIRPRASKK
jgi:hypothetical protein